MSMLPDCMLPDGAEPCRAYRDLQKENEKLKQTAWRPCSSCTDPMDCGSWSTCMKSKVRARDLPVDKGHWIGVDLDGVLAVYDKWTAWNIIGPPIPRMVERIKKWVAEGKDVRIFTARAAFDEDTCVVTKTDFTREDMVRVVQDWLEKEAGLPRLPVTSIKDFRMVELWDDRCVQMVPNTGRTLAEEHAAVLSAHEGKAADPSGLDGHWPT